MCNFGLAIFYLNTTLVSVQGYNASRAKLFYGFKYNPCVGSSHIYGAHSPGVTNLNTTLVSVQGAKTPLMYSNANYLNTTLVSVQGVRFETY